MIASSLKPLGDDRRASIEIPEINGYNNSERGSVYQLDGDLPDSSSSPDEHVTLQSSRQTGRPRKPKAKSTMVGKMRYLGKDRVCPVDWLISMLTFAMIVIPSAFVLVFTIFWLCGKIGGAFLAAFYLLSVLNLLRIHHNCRNTEPGILPNIRSKRIDYNKSYNVRYRKLGEILDDFPRTEHRSQDAAHAQAFFSTRHWEMLPPDAPVYTNQEDDERDNCAYPLTVCSTCKILRPPRSFHCGDCGVCIEIHDHHCPWMGTCIGKRNARYFVLFLFYTALHCFLTFTICILFVIFVSVKRFPQITQGLNSKTNTP